MALPQFSKKCARPAATPAARPLLTLDANVFIAALKPDEPDSDQCRALIRRVADAFLLSEPSLVYQEVCGTLARRLGGELADNARAQLDAMLLPAFVVNCDRAYCIAAYPLMRRVRHVCRRCPVPEGRLGRRRCTSFLGPRGLHRQSKVEAAGRRSLPCIRISLARAASPRAASRRGLAALTLSSPSRCAGFSRLAVSDLPRRVVRELSLSSVALCSVSERGSIGASVGWRRYTPSSRAPPTGAATRSLTLHLHPDAPQLPRRARGERPAAGHTCPS